MFNKDGKQHRAYQPDDHYIEVGRWYHRPPLKFFSLLVAFVIVFAAGMAAGRGNYKIWQSRPAAADSTGLDYTSVSAVYNLLKANYDGSLDLQKLDDGMKAGLVNALGDPYTEYFDPSQAQAFNNELNGQITGIGAELGTDSQNDIVIVSPLDGYPAQKAGLQPKDIITEVNSQSTQSWSVDEAVSKIRGPAGTKVTLTIVRGSQKPFDVTITRQNITVPSVTYSEIGDIGYLKISQFSNDTEGLAQKAAQEFKDKGVKGVILDLRGNPGGYLLGAVDISSLWLDRGQTVVSERRGSTVIDTEYATGNDILHGLPTVVLIDGGSASASEITAGALHDNNDAQLVGVKSFGKGSVQQVKQLPDGSELKITIARWYTPDGKNIDKQGITPDITVARPSNSTQDLQKAKALQILQAKI